MSKARDLSRRGHRAEWLDNGNMGIGDSNPDDKLQVRGTITSQHDIASEDEFSLFSARSSRTNNDYGGLDKKYMQMKLVTPGPSTTGESNQHAYGDLRFSLVDGADTSLHDWFTIRNNGRVGIRTTTPDGLLHTRGTNVDNGSSTHGAEVPIRMIGGSNGTTVKEWVHATRTTTSPSHTTMYSWYKLFSPGGYSSAGTPGIWKLGCHISGCHATNAKYQEYIIVQTNNHSGVGDHGGANGSICSQRCDLTASNGAYGAGLTISVWYQNSGTGNNNATFYVRAVHNAREPIFTMHATYIGGTGNSPGGHPQNFSFLGTQTNNNHQPANISNIY